MIIVDGFTLGSLDVAEYWNVVEYCSEALLKGSVIVALWDNTERFMSYANDEAYGGNISQKSSSDGFAIVWAGFYDGDGSRSHSEIWNLGPQTDTPDMRTLTGAYEWGVRTLYDQPYHPTLYP